MKNDYSKIVELICPKCGSTTFSFDNESKNGIYECINCHTTYTKEQLINSNEATVNNNINDLKKDLIKDLKKDFKNIFK
jgi:uncharacterized Zn finger protein (UPF0148 family)